MTCEYKNINPDDAIYNLARAYPGGIEALAQRMGRPAQTLRKQLMPGVDTHHLSPDDFDYIIELCNEARMPSAFVPLHAKCWRLSHVAVRLPSCDTDAQELFQDVLDMLREEGEVANCIQGALSATGTSGSKVTAGELADVECHIERSIAALMKVREEVRAKHERDFPPPRERTTKEASGRRR